MSEAGDYDFWLLRTLKSDNARRVYEIKNDGSVTDNPVEVNFEYEAIRPALKLNNSHILFTSAANGGKNPIIPSAGSAISKNADLSTFSDNDGYKLTLLDSSRTFALSDTQSKSISPGGSLSIGYANAKTGANEYVSVMITSPSGEVCYYGQIAQPTTESGTAEFTLPSDIASGEYTLKFFNEQINGDYKTDYSSAFIDIPLTVLSEDSEDEKFSMLELGADKRSARISFGQSGTYTVVFADFEGTALNKLDIFEVTVDSAKILQVTSEDTSISLGRGDKIMLLSDRIKLVPKCEAYIVE